MASSAYPADAAAATEATFHVEPGAHSPCTACDSSGSARYSAAVTPSVHTPGSYEGRPASATTRPVIDSMITAAPDVPPVARSARPSARSATAWIRVSMLVTSVFPGTGGTSRTVRVTRPVLSTATSLRPARPASSPS